MVLYSTVKIVDPKKPSDFLNINAHDFDAGIHQLFGVEQETKEEKKTVKVGPEDDLPSMRIRSAGIRHRGGGWWDVINANGVVVSKGKLRKDDAEKLLEETLKRE